MATVKLIGNALHNVEMEYHGKFGHTIGLIQHIYIMNRIEICYTALHLGEKIVAPNLTGLQGLKICIQYLASHPHRSIFILLIITTDQISSDLHGSEIKLKTTQPKIVLNVINMQIMQEFLIENGMCQELFILLLGSWYSGKYI